MPFSSSARAVSLHALISVIVSPTRRPGLAIARFYLLEAIFRERMFDGPERHGKKISEEAYRIHVYDYAHGIWQLYARKPGAEVGLYIDVTLGLDKQTLAGLSAQ